MTLNFLRRILLALLFISLSTAFLAGLAHAQLPFDNLTPTEDSEDGELGPVEQEGPMRPIDRPPAARPEVERPSDDDIGSEEPEQSIEVNERYAGWEQVGDIDGVRLSDTLRANWVMLDRNGQFTGTVRGIDDAEVAGMTIFMMNNGRLVKTAAVQGDGSFVFTNVQRGAYSLVGWGEQAFFAFGVNVINDNPDADESTPTSINCYAFQNETTINTDWITHYAAQVSYRVYGRHRVGEGSDDPAKFYGFRGLVNNLPDSIPATSISSHRVATTADGRLVGRVHQMDSITGRPVDLRTTRVLLLEDDDVVASTTTDNFGVFEFQEVPNGSYGVVGAGVDGVGLIGITVGSSEGALNDQGALLGSDEYPIDFTLVSSETMGWLNHYANEVAYRRGLLAPRPPSRDARQQFAGGGGCANCQNQPEGCAECREQYMLSVCRQRGLTFEQWQRYCQGQRIPGQFSFNDIGDGALVGSLTDRIRRNTTRVNNVFDRAFYPEARSSQLVQEAIQTERQFQQANARAAQPGFAPQQQFAPQQFAPQPGFAPQQGSGTRFVPQQGSGTTFAPQQGSGTRFAPQQGSGTRF